MGAGGKVTLTAPEQPSEKPGFMYFGSPVGVEGDRLALYVQEGREYYYEVGLRAPTTADVMVTVGKTGDDDLSFDTDPGTAGVQNTLTFRPDNWWVEQRVRVSAATDADIAAGEATFSHTVTSTDPTYTGTSGLDLTVIEQDLTRVDVSLTNQLHQVTEGGTVGLTVTLAQALPFAATIRFQTLVSQICLNDDCSRTGPSRNAAEPED